MVNEAAQTFDITFKNLAPVDTLKKIKGLKVISHHANTISIHVHGELAPLFAELAKQHVIHIDARNLDLEETFIGFYEDKRKTL